ncbi:MAG: phosphodiester glycosidase family protein [bacterium]
MRKHGKIFFLLLVLGFLLSSPSFASAIRYSVESVLGSSVNVVTVDLNAAPELSIQVASGFPGTHEPFSSMVRKTRPAVAVTGTYFSTRSLYPVGDIVVGGKTLYEGMMGTVLALDEKNKIVFKRVEWGRHQDWTGFKTVLGSGPTLVHDGKLDVNPKDEGFRDPHVLGCTARIGIGVTRANKLLLAATANILSLPAWGEVMRRLGCVEAMNLDAGASMAFYYRGKYLFQPSRKLTNIILAYDAAKPTAALVPKNTATGKAGSKTSGSKKVATEKPAIGAAKAGKIAAISPKAQAQVQVPPGGAASGGEISSQPEIPPGWEQLLAEGRDLSEQGRYDEAIEKFQAARDLDKSNTGILIALGDAFGAAGDLKNAAHAFLEAADCSLQRKASDQTVSLYNKALEYDQDLAAAHAGLALAYSDMGDQDRASEEKKLASAAEFKQVVLAGGQENGENLEGLPKAAAGFSGRIEVNRYIVDGLGFSFSIPENWTLAEESEKLALNITNPEASALLSIQAVPLKGNPTPQEFESEFTSGTFMKFVLGVETTMAGLPSYDAMYEKISMGRCYGIRSRYFIRGEWAYIISLTTYAETYSSFTPYFNNLVQSFEFLNQP